MNDDTPSCFGEKWMRELSREAIKRHRLKWMQRDPVIVFQSPLPESIRGLRLLHVKR